METSIFYVGTEFLNIIYIYVLLKSLITKSVGRTDAEVLAAFILLWIKFYQ